MSILRCLFLVTKVANAVTVVTGLCELRNNINRSVVDLLLFPELISDEND